MISQNKTKTRVGKKRSNNSGLPTPHELKKEIPSGEIGVKTPAAAKSVIKEILKGNDDRLLMIVGPCSIHDSEAAMEYAWRLNKVRKSVEDKIVIVMRTYFEKPRTTVGWKGMLYDPDMDGSNNMAEGVKSARKLLAAINGIGMPCATELLDPLTLPYIGDLLSYVSIGARTSESQIHRQAVSGIDTPTGIKNSTDGSINNAVNAVVSVTESHAILTADQNGQLAVVQTEGNENGHVILRGGNDGPNYSAGSIERAAHLCDKSMVNSSVIVDCSHQNSQKKHERQIKVANEVVEDSVAGNSKHLKGIMIESNLNDGNQIIPSNKEDLKYGVSVTDACIGWEDTEKLIYDIYNRLG